MFSFFLFYFLFIHGIQLVSAYKTLSDSFLRAIPSPGADFDIHNGKLLAPILIPRVPGTPGQAKVQEHFVNFFQNELPKWTIDWQNSTSTTPVTGDVELPFANLIIRREPPWVKPGQSNLLTLVAHYDSLFSPQGFVGAIDSAAPCAMLMHVAKSIDEYITKKYDEIASRGGGGTVDTDMGVQILFLDGEEAFLHWSDSDSLYGSRSLAEHWSNTPNPFHPPSKFHKYRTPLSQISLFLLLDLLGSPNPIIPSYFLETHWAYLQMSAIEQRMRALNLLESSPEINFLPDRSYTGGGGGISDDHLPFMSMGVPVLHVIPSPFPRGIWHTMDDDGEHLDMETTRDWAKIVTAFACEWLDLMVVWDGPEE